MEKKTYISQRKKIEAVCREEIKKLTKRYTDELCASMAAKPTYTKSDNKQLADIQRLANDLIGFTNRAGIIWDRRIKEKDMIDIRSHLSKVISICSKYHSF